MFGIGSALIATAFGLAVAIFSVAMNNYLFAKAGEIEKDFELVKLIALSTAAPVQHAPQQQAPRPAQQTAAPARGRTWAEEERRI